MGNQHPVMPVCCTVLAENEQAVFTDCQGSRSVAAGPGFSFYACCTSLDTRPATILEKGQYAIILNDEDASRRAVYGPCVEWLGAREEVLMAPGSASMVRQCPSLTREEN